MIVSYVGEGGPVAADITQDRLYGFHRLVEIWPEVRRRVGDVRLVLVGGSAGEPGYDRRLRRMIEADGLGAVEDLEVGGGVGRGMLGGGTPRPRLGALGSGELGLSGGAITVMGAICGALGRRWDRSAIATAGGRRDWQQVARECVDVFQDVLRDRR